MLRLAACQFYKRSYALLEQCPRTHVWQQWYTLPFIKAITAGRAILMVRDTLYLLCSRATEIPCTCNAAGLSVMTSAACLSALLALCSPSAAITLTITIIESETFCFLVDWSACWYISYITLLIFVKNNSRESNVLLSQKKLRSFSGSCDPEIQFLSAHNFHIITQQIIYAIYVMSHTYIVEFFRGYASFDFFEI